MIMYSSFKAKLLVFVCALYWAQAFIPLARVWVQRPVVNFGRSAQLSSSKPDLFSGEQHVASANLDFFVSH